MTQKGRCLKRQEEEEEGAKSWQPLSSITFLTLKVACLYMLHIACTPAACFCAGVEFVLKQSRI